MFFLGPTPPGGVAECHQPVLYPAHPYLLFSLLAPFEPSQNPLALWASRCPLVSRRKHPFVSTHTLFPALLLARCRLGSCHNPGLALVFDCTAAFTHLVYCTSPTDPLLSQTLLSYTNGFLPPPQIFFLLLSPLRIFSPAFFHVFFLFSAFVVQGFNNCLPSPAHFSLLHYTLSFILWTLSILPVRLISTFLLLSPLCLVAVF